MARQSKSGSTSGEPPQNANERVRPKGWDEALLLLVDDVKEQLWAKFEKLQENDLEEAISQTQLYAIESGNLDPQSPDAARNLYEFAEKAVRKLVRRQRRAPYSLDPTTVEDPRQRSDVESDETLEGLVTPIEKDVLLRKFVDSRKSQLERDILNAYFWPTDNSRGYAPAVAKKHGKKPGTIRGMLRKLLREFEEYLRKNKCPLPAGRIKINLIKRFLASISGNRSLAAGVRKADFTEKDLSEMISWARNRPYPAEELLPSAVGLGKPTYVSTGFEALDVLLGGTGFIQGSSILIRGQAGSGKTTLALQIAKHAIDEGFGFVYASVEDQPEVLLDRVTRSFWEKSHQEYLEGNENGRVVNLTRYFDHDVTQQARDQIVNRALETSGMNVDDRDSFKKAGMARIIDHPHVESDTRKSTQEAMHDMPLDSLLEQLWDGLLVAGTAPVILVVDSLNALINGATMRFDSGPDRKAMLAVLNSFRRWRSKRSGNVTVIFLVERDARIESAAASYLADVVIDLGRRAVEHKIYEKEDKVSKWLQGIRFCRVRKGRGLPIQDRACAYEFEHNPEDTSENGIVFLPTYAAQGVVSLFHENPAMTEVISTLREHDAPALFPQVLVQQFSRSALQRMFSVSRRRSHISLRHPMMLSNIDEYWLKRLKFNKLIHPIPARKLLICPLPLEDSAEGAESSPFIKELKDKEEKIFAGSKNGEKVYYGVPQIANVGMLVYRKDLLAEIKKPAPDTWEEVEQICKLLKAKQKPHKLRLELRTYDTFLATALELAWAHGAFFKTVDAPNDKLRIEFDPKSHVIHLIAALARLRHWIFSLQIVPKGSSVEPDPRAGQDWVFARHWYSTWINVAMGEEVADARNDGAEYGILPIPLDAGHKKRSKGNAKHHSAWGEWYLAILHGSENIELGIELINNLMTARKITERARSGAALPTAERFFEITDEDCPETDKTFHEIRKQFFEDAKSRSDFDDYPLFARIFSAVLRTVTTNPRADIIETVRKGLLSIDPKFQWPDNVEQQLTTILSPKLAKSLRQL